MRLAFVTCVELGLSCIEEIYQGKGKLDLVITLRDDLAQQKSGRIYVDEFCAHHGIEVLKIKNINDEEAVRAVQAREIDWLFIIGWSQIAKRTVLQAPKRGVLGIHPTLLPMGRGRAPIPWAIVKGLTETGVTLFQLDEGVDTGPIIAQERLAIGPDETATTLYSRSNAAHRTLIRRVLPDLLHDRITLVAQDSLQATVWPQRTPEDGRITHNMSVEFVDKLVRATTRPYPGAFCQYDERILRIWRGKISDSVNPVSNGAIRIQLADGAFDALDYEFL